MADFNIGETVICSVEVKDDDGAYKDPSTSMKIMVSQTKPDTTIKVASTDMTKDSTGKYHYDVQTTKWGKGNYQVIYTATDSTRITIEKNTFELV